MTPPRKSLRWCGAAVVVLVVSVLSLLRYAPPLPTPLTLDLVLEPGAAGRSEPLIVTGRVRAGDFLFVRHLDGNRIAFGYEPWGEPSRISAPLPLPADHRVRLEIEMPALTQIRGVLAPPTDRLRLRANDTEVFNATVGFHVRFPREVSFAVNPIGGTACDAALHGRLLLPDGTELRGYPAPLVTLSHRLRGWFLVSRWQAVCALLAGLATFLCWDRLARESAAIARTLFGGRRAFTESRYGGRLLRRLWRHRWFVVTLAGASLSFGWMVSYGTFTFIYPERFGNFYDYQAESVLHGRLDVPDDAISDEAFIYAGRRYGYFGITPALLRMPLVIFGVAFGETSRAFMLAYFIATLAGCYLVLRAVRAIFQHDETPPPAWATLCLVGGAGLGSTIYYLGSRAYIYHEAILCGVMFAVLAAWCALRHFAAPERRWWVGSLALGILSVHARPPTGFFALTLLGAVALATLVRAPENRAALARRALAIGACCALGVFSFNVLSYLKFRTFEGCPLRLNVQYDAKRLARIDGKQFHLVNLPIAVDSYLVHPNFRFEAGFPWFFIGSRTPARDWAFTKIDYFEKTLGLPYAMPGLFALATIGGGIAYRRFPGRRPLIVAVGAAALPMTLAMFTAIAIAHRYTADFCPILLLSASIGIAGVQTLAAPWHVLFRRTIAVATVYAVLITFAITLHYQRAEVWGVPDNVRENYAALRHRLDGFMRTVRH